LKWNVIEGKTDGPVGLRGLDPLRFRVFWVEDGLLGRRRLLLQVLLLACFCVSVEICNVPDILSAMEEYSVDGKVRRKRGDAGIGGVDAAIFGVVEHYKTEIGVLEKKLLAKRRRVHFKVVEFLEEAAEQHQLVCEKMGGDHHSQFGGIKYCFCRRPGGAYSDL